MTDLVSTRMREMAAAELATAQERLDRHRATLAATEAECDRLRGVVAELEAVVAGWQTRLQADA